jgi:peptide/nickel transport system ATP-binding protein
MAEPLLQVSGLRVGFDVYGGTLRVLNGVNFYLEEGEKVGLVGETGCGKTTTAKAILRILRELWAAAWPSGNEASWK